MSDAAALIGRPAEIGVIDTMMAVPSGAFAAASQKFLALTKDDESKGYDMPAQHLFADLPAERHAVGPEALLVHMDRFGVDQAMIGVSEADPETMRALDEFGDRFFGSVDVNPHGGRAELQRVRDLVKHYDIAAVSFMPSGLMPPVPIDDRLLYPLYATCIELDLAICMCTGVPGPRVPMAAQHPEALDRVCYDFPDARFVMRHGAEPWEALAVKLLLKWPNLYYSTTAFAPRYYPKAIVDYANTRGADKVIYGGYFPMGLALERIMRELDDLQLRPDVWPKFLRENARRVFRRPA